MRGQRPGASQERCAGGAYRVMPTERGHDDLPPRAARRRRCCWCFKPRHLASSGDGEWGGLGEGESSEHDSSGSEASPAASRGVSTTEILRFFGLVMPTPFARGMLLSVRKANCQLMRVEQAIGPCGGAKAVAADGLCGDGAHVILSVRCVPRQAAGAASMDSAKRSYGKQPNVLLYVLQT